MKGMSEMDLRDYIIDVPDFPKEGIIFKDITPLLRDRMAYTETIDMLLDEIMERFPETTLIASPEARGFWFGCPVATIGGFGFIPIRKPGKLPREQYEIDFELEYNKTTLCMHKDAIGRDDKVVIIDDVLATGGTIRAIEDMIDSTGSKVLGTVVLAELKFLNGRNALKHELVSLIEL